MLGLHCCGGGLFSGCSEQLVSVRGVRCSVVSDSLWPHGLWSASLLCPWHSPGKNIGVGSHYLLQGIFQIQAFELRSPAFQSDSLLPRKKWAGATLYLHCGGFSLLWFLLLPNTGSRAHRLQYLQGKGLVVPQHVGSSWVRDRIRVSCIGRRILYH